MKWYRTDPTYYFQQPVGKQYPFGNGPKELSELGRWFRCFDMCPVFWFTSTSKWCVFFFTLQNCKVNVREIE